MSVNKYKDKNKKKLSRAEREEIKRKEMEQAAKQQAEKAAETPSPVPESAPEKAVESKSTTEKAIVEPATPKKSEKVPTKPESSEKKSSAKAEKAPKKKTKEPVKSESLDSAKGAEPLKSEEAKSEKQEKPETASKLPEKAKYEDPFAKAPKVLEIKNLHTYFYTDEGVVKSVNDVSYFVRKGETLGVVGESGCGKSVTAMSILRLIPSPPGKIVSGQILFQGTDLTKISYDQLREIRGNRIAMIFQEPMTSLNPVYTVGDQIIEVIQQHTDKSYMEARQLAIKMLDKVGIPAPDKRIDVYPHQMSGGMKQRVMIAMALVCDPELLIADEPTTALDVTIQAQILELLLSLQKEFHTSIILITHDLGVIAEMAHRVVVMYASKIVESADVRELFANPKHPYTVGLFNSIPKMDVKEERLIPIRGMVPNPLEFPKGCKFNNRCEHVIPRCMQEEPTLKEVAPRHWAACWLNEGE